jgi:mRNA interferase YafQ
MLTPSQTTKFKKDVKKIRKRNLSIKKLEAIIETLLKEISLSPKYRDHELAGNWRGYRECHIEPDWLLIYKVEDTVLNLIRTGSHSDLF